MNIFGIRSVAIDRLQLPGDMRARMEKPEVVTLSDDLSKFGQYIHDPLVRESDMRLIAGRDRIAGAKLLGRDTMPMKVCECTDDEADELELVENVHRRAPDPKLVTKLLDLIERRISAPESGNQGRPKTTRGAAREELAARTGKTKHAIEEADRRGRQEEPPVAAGGWGADEPEGEPEAPVEMLGTERNETWEGLVRDIQESLDDADQHAQRIQSLLTNMGADNTLAIPESRRKRMHQAAHQLAHDLRACRPVSACPFCKRHPDMQPSCVGCATNGYIMEDQVANTPKELLDVEAGLVARDGKFFRPGEPAKKNKRVKVLDGDGNEIKVEE